MQILITGANGFLGSHLARRLAARGDAVRALIRPGADRTLLDGVPNTEFFDGDVTEPASLARAVRGAQVVFHLAGLRRAPEREAFFRVNAESTRNVCEAILNESPGARLVLCSSLAAVGPRSDFPDEAAPLAPRDWYGESKAEAERIARAYADRIPVVIARPSRILGPGDRENLILFKLAAMGWRLAVGRKPRPISTIDVEDAAEALVRMGDSPEAIGRAFFVNRDTTSLPELGAAAAAALGAKVRTLWLPEWGLRALGQAADGVSRVTGRHLPINRKLAQQLLVPGWTCSTRALNEELGFVAAIPIEDSMARAARWYLEHGWISRARAK